jgi:hypothetical protein
MVALSIPARAGPMTKPRLEAIPIFPKFLLLFSSDEISATYASATDTFPPVRPSTALARNRTAKGRVITKVPINAEFTLKRSLTGKNKATKENYPSSKCTYMTYQQNFSSSINI